MAENELKNDQPHDLLIAEDKKTVRESLEETLGETDKFKVDIDTVGNGDSALEKVRENDYDLVLSDQKMPGMNGVDLLKRVMEIRPEAVRILITGSRDVDLAKQAINEANVHEYIEKPWEDKELELTIDEKLKRKEERESDDIENVTNVVDALSTLKEYQTELTKSPGEGTGKEIFVFEFDTDGEFNKFSFELKNIKNASIEDVHVFENKYIIRVGLYPSSFSKIK